MRALIPAFSCSWNPQRTAECWSREKSFEIRFLTFRSSPPDCRFGARRSCWEWEGGQSRREAGTRLFSWPPQPLFVRIVTIPLPIAWVAATGQTDELFQLPLQLLVVACNVLQVLANLLVQAFARRAQLLSRPLDQLLVDGQSNIHRHSIRVHITCVNRWAACDETFGKPTILPERWTRILARRNGFCSGVYCS